MKKISLRCILSLLCLLMLLTGTAQAVETDYSDHVLLVRKGSGSCQTLTGNVAMTVVFVDLPDASWTDEAKQARQATIDEAIARLKSEAAAYGVSLSFTAEYYSAYSTENVSISGDSEVWAEAVLDRVPELAPLYYEEDKPTFYRNIPILFCLNTGGRAFAHSETSDRSAEYLVLFAENAASTIRHELLHLYGAQDYYIMSEIELAADKYCPDSIMLSTRDNENTVDSLTAYTIGWCTTPDEAADAFLQDTAYITQDDVSAAKEQDRITGYGVKEGTDYTYSGMMVDGFRHGYGKIVWDSGNSYVGDWVWSKRTGQGTYTWADGDVYTGDFVDSTRTGHGTYTWPSGNTYTGDFVDGARTGRGTYTWANGDTYTGNYVDGDRTGQGTLTWADGDTYTGDFVDGTRTGRGTYTWANGNTYTGDFVDGTRTGQGIFTWANGNVYTGDFVDNVGHGHGTCVWADGNSYTGEWINGKRTGYGTYIWANGDVYFGEFVDGHRSGYGILRTADGTVTMGQWENDEYIGE